MRNILLKKGLCLVLLTLISFSIIPITSGMNEKVISPKSTLLNENPGDNLLSEIEINWLFWFQKPEISIITNPSGKNFEFPKDFNGNIELNFTVYYKHKLETSMLFPSRWTHVEFSIKMDDEFIYQKPWNEWETVKCNDTVWEEITIYLDQKDEKDPGWKVDKIYANNTVVNLSVSFSFTGYPPFYFIFPDYTRIVNEWTWFFTVTSY